MVSHTSCVYLDYRDFMQNDFITGATRQRRLRRGCPGFGHAPPDMPGGWPRPSRAVMGDGSTPHLSRDWFRPSRCVWRLTPPPLNLSRVWPRPHRAVQGLAPPPSSCLWFGPAPIELSRVWPRPRSVPRSASTTCCSSICSHVNFVYRLSQFTRSTSQIYIFDVFGVLLCSGKEPSPIPSVDSPQTGQTCQ